MFQHGGMFHDVFVVLWNRRHHEINASLKCIVEHIKEAGILRWGKFPIGTRCYLIAFLAVGLLEASRLLSQLILKDFYILLQDVSSRQRMPVLESQMLAPAII